jgi:hypothetical protein
MKTELREKVWKKYNCKCAYCGEDLEYNKMQVDHIESKCLGGSNEFDNYNPSCRQCNFYKGIFSLDEFKRQLFKIEERIKKQFIVRLALKYNIISFKNFDGKFYYEKYKQEEPKQNEKQNMDRTRNPDSKR